MAHPSREEFFPYLKEKLGDVPFAIDTEGKGEWDTCKRAWMMYDPEAEWHVVIQDDALICKEFVCVAVDVIKRAKEVLRTDNYACNFYYGYRRSARQEGEDAFKRGYWINKYPKWGVAICIQTKYIKEMVNFGDTDIGSPRWGTRDDERIGAFISSKKMPIYFPMPSIVDHRHGKSLVGDPGENRGAYKFIDN